MERKGICQNKGVCSLANGDKVQVITDDDAPFECQECGEELKPYVEEKETPTRGGGKKPNGKLIGIIAAVVLVLGGLGYGGYALYDAHQQSEQEKAQLRDQAAKAQQEAESAQTQLEGKKAEDAERQKLERQQAALVEMAKQKGDSIIAANEKLLKEKSKKLRDDAKSIISAQITSLRTACDNLQYENMALIDTMEVAINEAWKNAEKPLTTGGGSSNFGKASVGFGTYEGPLKGGKPHGVGGTIRVSRSYSIDLKKANGQTVEVGPGDVLNSVKMENGRFIQGQLKRADGSQRWIIIG
jgi:hypothetical protein